MIGGHIEIFRNAIRCPFSNEPFSSESHLKEEILDLGPLS